MSVVRLRLQELIRRLRPCQVVTVSDVMLDHYVKGNADQLGLEAPIHGAGTISLVLPVGRGQQGRTGSLSLRTSVLRCCH
jgi:hypothetical protein